MKSLRERYGNWALVAGAAEGIGEAFTVSLAMQGFNIILADNKGTAMESLAHTVRVNYKVATRQLLLDLSHQDAPDRCLAEANASGCRLMVYVAAYSHVARFTSLSRNELDLFIDINTKSLLHLVHGFSNVLISRKERGGILLVSSLAGLIGPQFVATYAATKAFSIRLTEALSYELKPSGIDITVCMAGMAATPTFLGSNPSFEKIKPGMLPPMEIAAYSLSKLGKRSRCIPGWKNRMQYFLLQQILPRRLATWLVNDAMKKMYKL
jgi:short-subunit dehydrogenase